jgi:glycosyltransferase involved in cell wall biosynthesis
MKVVTNRSLISMARRLEEFLYRRAALITGQTQGIVTDIRRRMPRKRVRLVTNGADLDRFGPEKADPSLLDELGLDGRFIVGYAGVHGLAQSLDRVIDAAIHLKEFPDIVIACFGDGPLKERLVRQAREKRLENVRFFPAQCRERMPGLVAHWGVGLVPLYGGTLARGALPSKMFEIMAASVPVLLSAPAGEASALIEEAQGGVCVEPENPAALAEAVVKLYRDASLRRQLGGNARAYVTRRYDRQIIAEQLLRHLSELGFPERAFVEPNPVLRS